MEKFYENFHKAAFTTKTKKKATKAISKACKVYIKQRKMFGEREFDMQAQVRQKFEELWMQKTELREQTKAVCGRKRKKGRGRGGYQQTKDENSPIMAL